VARGRETPSPQEGGSFLASAGEILRPGPSPNPPNRTRILGAGRPIRVLAPARAHLQIDRYARSRARRRLRLGTPRIPICIVRSVDPGSSQTGYSGHLG
jgi:hypothetical protein